MSNHNFGEEKYIDGSSHPNITSACVQYVTTALFIPQEVKFYPFQVKQWAALLAKPTMSAKIREGLPLIFMDVSLSE